MVGRIWWLSLLAAVTAVVAASCGAPTDRPYVQSVACEPSVAVEGELASFSVSYTGQEEQAFDNTELVVRYGDYLEFEGAASLPPDEVNWEERELVWLLGTLEAGDSGSVEVELRLAAEIPLEVYELPVVAEISSVGADDSHTYHRATGQALIEGHPTPTPLPTETPVPPRPLVVMIDRNQDDLTFIGDALAEQLPVEVTVELTNPDWDRQAAIRELDPDLIVIHISAFADPEDRMRPNTLMPLAALLVEMYDSKTAFLFYTGGIVDFPELFGQQLMGAIWAESTNEPPYPFEFDREEFLEESFLQRLSVVKRQAPVRPDDYAWQEAMVNEVQSILGLTGRDLEVPTMEAPGPVTDG